MSSNGHGHKIDFGARRRTILVEVPELGETFRLRALSVAQVETIREFGGRDTAVHQLAMAIVDDQGQRLYTTDEDLANLREMAITVSQILVTALNSLHGITAEAQEGLVKKFEASRDTASASDSPPH
jgi:hypothetical protein